MQPPPGPRPPLLHGEQGAACPSLQCGACSWWGLEEASVAVAHGHRASQAGYGQQSSTKDNGE